MKFCLTNLILLSTALLQAQSFEDFIKKGELFYSEGKYSESAEAYSMAFEKGEGSATQYYYAACSWALTGDTIQSMEFLNLSADLGWTNVSHINRDSDLVNLHEVKGWDAIIAKVQANLDEYEKDFDKPLKKRLEEIYLQDQTLRQLYQHAEEKFGKESDEMNYFWGVVAKQDSVNEAAVIQILEERGWVGQSVVGGKANITLWLVIQHAPLETQEKYLPLLRESVKLGESSGRHLAMLEDRIQKRNGRPQTYGSQITVDEETGEQMIYEIWEPEYVNQRRREVGLGPIEDYVKRFGLTWTIEQKEK